VKKHMYQWKSDMSDEANESRILAKIVNMKKKFNFGPADAKTSQDANQIKRVAKKRTLKLLEPEMQLPSKPLTLESRGLFNGEQLIALL
jgi:hypothetical protein